MELAGGLLLGVILMFTLLAYNPTSTSLSNWVSAQISRFATTTQVAGVGSATIPIVDSNAAKDTLSFSSAAFSNGGFIPPRFTCDGANISPPLSISGVPEKAQSLVLIMDDPDAPKETWDHWVVFNMPPTTRDIPEGKEPVGRAGVNSWGKTGYRGPCPSSGEHRYFFRIYALSRALALPVGSTKAQVLAAMKGYVLEEGELVGRYQRPK